MENLCSFATVVGPCRTEEGVALKQIKVKIGDRWYTVDIEEPIGSVAKVTVEGEIFEV